MLCPGQNTVRSSQFASEGCYFCRVKNNVPYLEGQFVGGGQLETNSRWFCIMQDRFFFNIREWAFIRGQILGNLLEKSAFFGVQTGEWASIRAWASNRDFTVCKKIFQALAAILCNGANWAILWLFFKLSQMFRKRCCSDFFSFQKIYSTCIFLKTAKFWQFIYKLLLFSYPSF